MKKIARYALFPFAALFLFTFCNCNTIKDEAKAVGQTVVDCTKQTAAKAIVEYGPAVAQVVIDAVDSSGKVDKERVKSATMKFASDDARCVLASTIARLMKPPSADSPQSSPVSVDLADLQALHKEQLGGLRYKLPDGML